MKAGLEKVVRQALSQGLSTETIITLTGLSAEEIEKFRELVSCDNFIICDIPLYIDTKYTTDGHLIKDMFFLS